MDLQYDIFIAYKREDREKANSLKVIFEQRGWRVFIDTDINAGAHFSVELEQALDASRSVVVLWSESSKQSRYVLDEANEAAERGVLFPALIEDTRIPYGFRQFQAVDLVAWQGELGHVGCDRLIDVLESHLGQGIPTKTTSIHLPDNTFRDTLSDGSKGPEMLTIRAGSFLMGSPEGLGEPEEHPRHLVKVPQHYSMSKNAISFDEYDAFCRAENYKLAKDLWGRGKQPVINISWHDAVAYCYWLSQETNKDYQLPPEALWEYACRSGTNTTWCDGQNWHEIKANYGSNVGQTVEVDSYEPNSYGLHQMHGNVWEWCSDPWHTNYNGAPINCEIWNGDDSDRVLRGGSWSDAIEDCRSSSRLNFAPDRRDYRIGFRLSCLSLI